MRKYFAAALLILSVTFTRPARADFWGGDIPILLEILANAVKQLTQLQQALGTARSQLDFIRQVNRGINDSIRLIRGTYPAFNPKLYEDWDRIQKAIAGVTDVYGPVPDSRDQRVQTDADQSVAEAITLNNQLAKYSRDVETLSEQLRNASSSASPGRAQQITAASLASLISLTNQGLRTQATGLKLQAQSLAIGNRKEKEETRTMLGLTGDLSGALKQLAPKFELPRF